MSDAFGTAESHAVNSLAVVDRIRRSELVSSCAHLAAASHTKSVCVATRSVDLAHVQCPKGFSRIASSSQAEVRLGMLVQLPRVLCWGSALRPSTASPHSNMTDAVAIGVADDET